MPSKLFPCAASIASRPLRALETRKPYSDSPASNVRRIRRSSSAIKICGWRIITIYSMLLGAGFRATMTLSQSVKDVMRYEMSEMTGKDSKRALKFPLVPHFPQSRRLNSRHRNKGGTTNFLCPSERTRVCIQQYVTSRYVGFRFKGNRIVKVE